MKILYLDCFSGVSGDMVVGALIDAGVPLEAVRQGLDALGLGEDRIRVSVRNIVRSQIHATKLDYDFVDSGEDNHSEGGHRHDVHSAPEHEHVHEHDHTYTGREEHEHDHGHVHEPGHVHGSDHGHSHQKDLKHGHHPHHPHQSYRSIVRMIEQSALRTEVKECAISIFRAIAIGEARIHQVEVDDVTFHEVGALDSIADIVAVAVCLDHLGVAEVYSLPVPLGSGGTITTQHGVMPLPAPATLEILKGYPVQLTDIPFELTTPTGAGIIKALSRGTLSLEQIVVERIGFGAGTRELPGRPNLLRAVIGELTATEEQDEVAVIETNIDDLNPQVYPFLFERLLEGGALDLYLTQVIMKKGRPGILLTVISEEGAVDSLTRIIWQETTSIGVRLSKKSRRKLSREEIVAPTEFGPVRMKRIGVGAESRIVPEYEEARRIARERSLPLQQVLRQLNDAARRG